MKCKSCEYSLWNLTARVCPECSAPFKPSDYEFKPNGVRFCCPYCDQNYYGTDPRGLLTPRAFVCVSCQRPIEMDAMVLRPADGVAEAEIEVGTVPWSTDRSKFSGFFRTVGEAMTSPSKIGDALRGLNGERGAFSFALLVNFVGIIISFGLQVVVMMGMGAAGAMSAAGGSGPGRGAVGPGMMVGATMLAGLVGVTAWFALWVLWLFVWSGVSHGLLRLVGCNKYEFRKTMGVVCYSTGPMVIGWVPCIGQWLMLVGSVWRVCAATVMISRLYPERSTRAALCLLVPPGVALLSLITVAALLIGGVWNAARMMPRGGPFGGMVPPPATGRVVESSQVGTALQAWRAEKGAWPRHAVELADGRFLQPGDLMLDIHRERDDEVVIGGRRLSGFHMMLADEQRELVDFERARFEAAGSVPYRLGDYVFCFDGVDPAATPERWIYVQCDRDLFVPPPFGVRVGLADGSEITVADSDWPAALAAENAARAAAGLPAIADPFGPTALPDAMPPAGPDGDPAGGGGG